MDKCACVDTGGDGIDRVPPSRSKARLEAVRAWMGGWVDGTDGFDHPTKPNQPNLNQTKPNDPMYAKTRAPSTDRYVLCAQAPAHTPESNGPDKRTNHHHHVK